MNLFRVSVPQPQITPGQCECAPGPGIRGPGNRVVSSLPCGSGDREEGQWFARGQMQPEEVVGEAGSLLHGSRGLREGFGCRSGGRSRCSTGTCLPPAAIPNLPLNLYISRLSTSPRSGPPPAGGTESLPLQNCKERQIALGSHPLGDPTEPGQPPQRPQKIPGPQSCPFRRCLSKPGQVPVLGRHSIAVLH